MITERMNELEKKYQSIQKEINLFLQTVPAGHIKHEINKAKHCYYHCQKGMSNGTYLRDNDPQNMKLIRTLCQKRYCCKLAIVLEKNIKALEYAKNRMSKTEPGSVYDNLPEGIKEYVKPYILSNKEYAKAWDKEKYRKSTYAPTTAVYETDKGDMVRSKTEVIIANKLFAYGIPYKYEKVYNILDYGEFAPDFTILNTKTRQIFIWEHFGLMGNSEYRNNAMKKIEMYTEYENKTGVKFIATFEDEYRSITTSHINMIIKNNFT